MRGHAPLRRPGPGQRYEDLPTTAGVGAWEPNQKSQSYKISVDGEEIRVNGVLQKVRFDPQQDIAIRNGEAVLVPKGQGLTLTPRAVEGAPSAN